MNDCLDDCFLSYSFQSINLQGFHLRYYISYSSTNLKCESPYCNKNSSAITSTIYNWTDDITNNGAQYDFIIISEGTIVYAPYASWCDGISNCFDNTDEINCGFNTIETLFYGNQT